MGSEGWNALLGTRNSYIFWHIQKAEYNLVGVEHTVASLCVREREIERERQIGC